VEGEKTMGTTQGLDMDMNTAGQWPGRVRVGIRIEHARGQPEEWRLALDPGAAPCSVTVAADAGLTARGEGRHLIWQDLPGRTLRMRSLGAVAVAMFDSVRMVPRICGLPLWRSASLVLSAEGHELRSTQIELLADAEAPRAVLRHRHGLNEPWIERAIVLLNWDADPMRAMLRHGMALREAGPRPLLFAARSHASSREGPGLPPAPRPGETAASPLASH